MKTLLKEIRHNPLLWLLAFVPVVFAVAKLKPEAHTLLFVLSVLAIRFCPTAHTRRWRTARQFSRGWPVLMVWIERWARVE